MDKTALKAELSLKISTWVIMSVYKLSVTCSDVVVIRIDFTNKHCIQAHIQVDYLLKSKDQIGNMILKHALTGKNT